MINSVFCVLSICNSHRLGSIGRFSAGTCLCFCFCFLHGGCSNSPAPAASEVSVIDLSVRPLTIEVWKQSRDQEKYSPEIINRLRAENPTLKSTTQWKKFYQEVVLPGFQRDVAGKSNPAASIPE